MPPEGSARLEMQDAVVPAVTRLSLRDFRCYRTAELAPERPLVVLTGPNGAGKTNLLEALSLLSPGRGLRRAKLDELERLGSAGQGWAVAASVTTLRGPVEIGTGRLPEAAPAEATGGTNARQAGRRIVRIDGVTQRSQASLGERLAVAWLTPQMDRLFIEGASGRRRLLDRMVFGSDADHARRLVAYEQAMRDRLRLLGEPRPDPAWLAALEEGMAEEAAAIAAARIALVADLAAALASGVGPFPVPDLALEGLLEQRLAEADLATVPESQRLAKLAAEFRVRLVEQRRADQAAGATLLGPHRTDMLVTHRAKSMPAALCSTGEQKALLIALHLAHARLVRGRRGAAPLMLLDEIAAHLDGERRHDLFTEIVGLGGQAWLTGTETQLFRGLEPHADFFAVADGMVTRAARLE